MNTSTLWFRKMFRNIAKYRERYALLFLVVFACMARFIFLVDIPRGLNWDETAYGYNAFSLLKTGADEWGYRWPIFLKSFGDYKPALLSYLLLPVFIVLGPTNLAVRVVPAVFGVIGVLTTYALVKKLTRSQLIAYIAALTLAMCPWHIHFSRVALDPGIAHTLLLVGMAFWLQKNVRSKTLGTISLLLSMYAYNAERVFGPMLLSVFLLIFWFGAYRKNFKKYWAPLLMFFVGAVSLVYILLFTVIGTRANFVSLLSPRFAEAHPKVTQLTIMVEIGRQYLSSFHPRFLFLPNGNAHDAAIFGFKEKGNLLEVFLPFFVVGVVVVVRKKPSKADLFFLVWLFLAPIPGALTVDAPHAGRTLIMLPAIQYFIAVGVDAVVHLAKKFISPWRVYAAILFIFCVSFVSYWTAYVREYPAESEYYFSGYVDDPVKWMHAQQKLFRNIYVTSTGEFQILHFYAWYNKVDPQTIQHATRYGGPFPFFLGEFNNVNLIAYSPFPAECKLLEPRSLVVLTAGEASMLETTPVRTFGYHTLGAEYRSNPIYVAFSSEALLWQDIVGLQKRCKIIE